MYVCMAFVFASLLQGFWILSLPWKCSTSCFRDILSTYCNILHFREHFQETKYVALLPFTICIKKKGLHPPVHPKLLPHFNICLFLLPFTSLPVQHPLFRVLYLLLTVPVCNVVLIHMFVGWFIYSVHLVWYAASPLPLVLSCHSFQVIL